jgi:hypothetical protein
MKFKTIVQTIFQMEEELDLFNKKIDGVYFWELIRRSVVLQIAQQTDVYGRAHTILERNKSYIVNYGLNALKSIFSANPFFGPKTDLLFIGHQRRKLLDDGLWWDVYCDPVIEYLHNKEECLLLESAYQNNHLTPSKTRLIKYLDPASFAGALLKRSKLIHVSLLKIELLIVYKIEEKIKKKFNTDIALDALVRQKLIARKCMLPVYSRLLKKIMPKIVVFLVSYGHELFIEACKRQNITTIEFQHGSMSRYDTAYSFPIKNSRKRMFPDYFFAFGDYWKNLVQFPISEEKVISVGFPFFEMGIAKYRNEPKKDQIIFISQGTIGAKLSKFAVDLGARHDFHMDIAYKLHPGEYARWRKEYPWLVDASIRVIDDESEPLYKILAQSKALIGVYSTVVYEGLGLGLPTYLVDLPGIEYMDELITSGAVTKVGSVDELIMALNNPQSNPVPADQFFKPNALENISNALEEILQKSKARGGLGAARR